ncbi:hypothetical protein ACFO0S_14770 [Chryseomicrobium palamuruense]|uniref:Uncharacterized protein n=1 Tax=Chryseomicrobium palamuruense TaxID=682973 RepID=A0ABV8UZT6_9BACL
MPTDTLTIVPVQLETKEDSKRNQRPPVKPICTIQINETKVNFYPDVKPFIIQTVLRELTRHDH